MKTKKIIVTGCAGFLGSHLAENLAAQGHQIYGIDNLSTGRIKNVPKTITFIKCDLRNGQETEKIVKKIKAPLVYHLAAWAHEGLSHFMPKLITENNYNAFLNLLVPSIKNGLQRIVITSSFSVYGDQKPPFSENMPTKPVDVYAVSKTAMEETVKILSQVHNFEYVLLRPHNAYGPRQAMYDPYRNAIAIFINRILKGQPPIIYGDGNQTRSFTYVDDIIPLIAKSGFLKETKNQTINLGPTQKNTINQVANLILKALKSDIPVTYVPDRPKEVKHGYCTNAKAKKIFKKLPYTDLKTGIEKTVLWAKELGPQKFEYLKELELESQNTPQTWSKKLV